MTASDVITKVRQRLKDWSSQFPDVTMLASDAIGDVRAITGDTGADSRPYRVSDATMVVYANDGQREIVKREPWLLWQVDGTARNYADASSTGSTLFVPNRFRAALVQYMVDRCASMEAGDKWNEAMANDAMKRFEAALATSPWRWQNSVLLNYGNIIMLDIWDARPHVRVADDGTFNTYADMTISGDTIPSGTLCLPNSCQQAMVAGITYLALQGDYANQVMVIGAQRIQQEYQRLLTEI